MKYYQEITLLDIAEINQYFLWSKLYGQVHLALASIETAEQTVPVGVSFPAYDSDQHKLGNKLRLFAGSEEILNELNIASWLSLLLDYCHITTIRSVPPKVQAYASYKRKQAKSSNMRMAKRKAQRHGISFEIALDSVKGHREEKFELPYINLKSISSSSHFKLFIAKETTREVEQSKFNSYGLMVHAKNNVGEPMIMGSVPEF